MVKGRFEKALARDSKIAWDMDDSDSVLVVMWIIFLLSLGVMMFYYLDFI